MQKSDIYQSVTDRIVASIERGAPSWVKPWAAAPDQGIDSNFVSKRPYHGINVLLLWDKRETAGYPRSQWLTFKQALDAGGNVRKGEKGTQVAFWMFPNAGDATTEEGEERKGGAFARAYTVFNVEQCDGLKLPDLETPKPETKTLGKRLAAVREFVSHTGAVVTHGGDRAFYSRDRDKIQLPRLNTFATPSDYASTLLHELTHWTGHASRCDRQFGKRFGDDAYAFEELVAELGCAFGCADLRINGKLQHDAYIANWLRVLKSDKRAVFTAASQARKAHEFLKNLQPKATEVAA